MIKLAKIFGTVAIILLILSIFVPVIVPNYSKSTYFYIQNRIACINLDRHLGTNNYKKCVDNIKR